MHVLRLEELEPEAFYFLPHELDIARRRLNRIHGDRAKLAVDMADARAGSTENMGHDDGAQEVLVEEAHHVATRAFPLETALHHQRLVDYPDATIGTVTIGSRVRIAMDSTDEADAYLIDVIGPFGRYIDIPGGDHEIDRVSYGSPLARYIFGRKPGETVDGVVAGRKRRITIFDIDQDAQRLEAEGSSVVAA